MNSIKKYFTIWWIPIVSYLIPIFLFILGICFKSDEMIDVALIIFYINFLGTIISSIVQIANKKYFLIIPQILVTFVIFFGLAFVFAFAPPDYYGANKTIPENIEIEIPLEREVYESDFTETDFKLAAVSQPGIYNYSTNFNPKQKGFFYIKVYEISTNDRLSEQETLRQSKILVNDFEQKIYSGEFTIYEGSWGDKYGARIELWFQPENGTEYKVLEKNYVVEGWMR